MVHVKQPTLHVSGAVQSTRVFVPVVTTTAVLGCSERLTVDGNLVYQADVVEVRDSSITTGAPKSSGRETAASSQQI